MTCETLRREPVPTAATLFIQFSLLHQSQSCLNWSLLSVGKSQQDLLSQFKWSQMLLITSVKSLSNLQAYSFYKVNYFN